MTGENTTLQRTPWLSRLVIGRNPKWTLVRVVILILTTFILFKFVLIPIRVVGISMEPNYPNRDWNLVNKLAYRFKKPERGDVVAIRMAGEHVLLLKRIIGLPGDRIRFVRSKDRPLVYVNDKLLVEDYVKRPVHPTWNGYLELTLSEDEYLVIGDNRSMAFSDHYKGTAFEHQIAGKVLF